MNLLMQLVYFALRRPITIAVFLLSIVLAAFFSISKMHIDILPDLGIPVIYVAQPYGGMSPEQMEGYITSSYEYHFLYISGIKKIESKNIQGAALYRLEFHPGTNMAQAMAETVAQVERSRNIMPPGTVPPFIMRFDTGSLPVGYLVFSSKNQSIKELQDMALYKIRPLFASLAGVSSPPPFGGNSRTIVFNLDPDKLRNYNISPEEAAQTLMANHLIIPAGNIAVGDYYPLTPVNSDINNIEEFMDIPIKKGAGPTIFLRDVGYVEDTMDILSGYALVDGKRSVYIPVTKRADASTWSVVQEVKKALPSFRKAVPSDVDISYEFDQSKYVRNALLNLVQEGLTGAFLTGLTILIFLHSWRSTLVVVTNIPLALLFSVVMLAVTGNTLNIMTMGGLALAVGILVDEATVEIENIHTHLDKGKSIARATVDSAKEISLPTLLAMFCIIAVFIPSFFMQGAPKALFVPLTLAVGFAMIGSYLFSRIFVPILAILLLKDRNKEETNKIILTFISYYQKIKNKFLEYFPVFAGFSFEKFREKYLNFLEKLLENRKTIIKWYLIAIVVTLFVMGSIVGKELFPEVEASQIKFRYRAPIGTRIEKTEQDTKKILKIIADEVGGEKKLKKSITYIGQQPSSYAVNYIFLWTSGPHESVVTIQFDKHIKISLNKLKEHLRKRVSEELPGSSISFEPADLISQVMSLGAPTPIEVLVKGKSFEDDKEFAKNIMTNMQKLKYIRDLQFGQPLEYPSIDININRMLAGQLGVNVKDLANSITAATSSTRFTLPNFWLDRENGHDYYVQLQIPLPLRTSIEDIQNVPAMLGDNQRPLLGDIAEINDGKVVGEYDHIDGQRMVTLTANLHRKDLGHAVRGIKRAIKKAGKPPRGVEVVLRGQVQLMYETLKEFRNGLLIAIIAIFLMLTANFQSFKVAYVSISTVPIALCGALIMLTLTHTTLNIQSAMGTIMAIGVSASNSILFTSIARDYQLSEKLSSREAALLGAKLRVRPIIMTSLAMIVGMIPMALGLGEGGEQTAPLGRAVIGGLFLATVVKLIILPLVYTNQLEQTIFESSSLDPSDPESKYYEKGDIDEK